MTLKIPAPLHPRLYVFLCGRWQPPLAFYVRVIGAHLRARGPASRVLLVTDPPPGAPLANPCAAAVLLRYPEVAAATGRGTLAEDLARLVGAAHLASAAALTAAQSRSICAALKQLSRLCGGRSCGFAIEGIGFRLSVIHAFTYFDMEVFAVFKLLSLTVHYTSFQINQYSLFHYVSTRYQLDCCHAPLPIAGPRPLHLLVGRCPTLPAPRHPLLP